MNGDWVEQARRLVESFGGLTGHTPATGSGQDAAECRWCPLCRSMAVLRGEPPEVTAGLADILTSTADALRAFAAATEGTSSSAAEAPAADPEPPVGDPPPVVQRIEIA